MFRLNRLIVTLFVCLFVFSCNYKKDSKVMEGDVLSVPIPEKIVESTLPWEELSELKNVVVLETSESSLIRKVDKVICFEDGFYILDIKGSSVFHFSKEGDFIRRMSRVGGGPGEYREIRDFDISSNGNLFILDYRRILVYNSQWEFQHYINLEVEKDKVPFIPLKFSVTENNDFYMWRGSFGIRDEDYRDKNAMFKVSRNGEVENSYIIFNNATVNDQRFYKNLMGKTLIAPVRGNDTIYSINEYGINNEYFVNFGKNKYVDNGASKDNVYSSISSILETSNHLFFKFNGNKNIYNAFYDKKSGVVKVEKMTFGKQYGLGPLVCTCGENFVGIVDSYILDLTLKNVLNEMKDDSKIKLLNKLKNLDRENNPVLFIHHIKEFQ